MDKTPAYSIFLGILTGTIFGLGIGAVHGDAVHGIQLGAMAGVFAGWVVTALPIQK